MKQYLELLKHIKDNGEQTDDRTGTGTRSIFGAQLRYDLTKGFPLLTTKHVSFKVACIDLLWMLSGSTNTQPLNDQGVHIWDEWATDDGELGPIYGVLWRDFPCQWSDYGVDQITSVIDKIKSRPNSRSLIVTAVNPETIPDETISPQQNVYEGNQCLASCQTLFQFKVYGNRISLQLYQRSADIFLGVPINLAQYSLLLHLVAHQCDLIPNEFIHTFGDVHIYNNHFEQVNEQLSRVPNEVLPQLVIKRKPNSIFKYTPDDFEIVDYYPQERIQAPISI